MDLNGTITSYDTENICKITIGDNYTFSGDITLKNINSTISEGVTLENSGTITTEYSGTLKIEHN